MKCHEFMNTGLYVSSHEMKSYTVCFSSLVPFASTLPASSFHGLTSFGGLNARQGWLIHVNFHESTSNKNFQHPSTEQRHWGHFYWERVSLAKLRWSLMWNSGRGDPSKFPAGKGSRLDISAKTMWGQIWVDDFPFPVWWWDMLVSSKDMSQVHTFILQIWS